MAKKRFSIEEIESKVIAYIPTPNGRIGIIIPENKPTEEEWYELHKIVAEILISSAKSENATCNE